MPPRRYVLNEANYRQLLDRRPNLAVLPWGATEAHNYHLPHGTDVIQVTALVEQAAARAEEQGARAVVLPTIPIGNDEVQLEGQIATLSFTTATAGAILDDIVRCLKTQGIDRLLLVNGHGGNEFRPLVRDIQVRHKMFIVLSDWYALVPDKQDELFEDPGNHAGEMETSLCLHLCPDWVKLEQAGPGAWRPFEVEGLDQPGVWAARPWNRVHPDTGAGDPKPATAEKGEAYLEALSEALARVIVSMSNASKGQLPYM